MKSVRLIMIGIAVFCLAALGTGENLSYGLSQDESENPIITIRGISHNIFNLSVELDVTSLIGDEIKIYGIDEAKEEEYIEPVDPYSGIYYYEDLSDTVKQAGFYSGKIELPGYGYKYFKYRIKLIRDGNLLIEEIVPKMLKIISPAQNEIITGPLELTVKSTVNLTDVTSRVFIEKFNETPEEPAVRGRCDLPEDALVKIAAIEPVTPEPNFYNIRIEIEGYPELSAEARVFIARPANNIIPLTKNDNFSNPAVCDIDKDGVDEIFAFKSQSLFMLDNGRIKEYDLGFFPIQDNANFISPLFGDIDGKNDAEIIVPYKTWDDNKESNEGFVVIYKYNSENKAIDVSAGVHLVLGTGAGEVINNIALSDLDGDGLDEIIITKLDYADRETLIIYDGDLSKIDYVEGLPNITALAVEDKGNRVFAALYRYAMSPEVASYMFSGYSLVEEWRANIEGLGNGKIDSIVLANIDNSFDGSPEIIASGYFKNNTKRFLTVFTDKGLPFLKDNIIAETPGMTDSNHSAALSIADLDGDGYIEIILPMNAFLKNYYSSSFHVYDYKGEFKFKTDEIGEGICSAVIGDINNDRISDIIASNAYMKDLFFMRNIYAWSGKDGKMLSGYPITIKETKTGYISKGNYPVLADIDGDKKTEVISRGLVGPLFSIRTETPSQFMTARTYRARGVDVRNAFYFGNFPDASPPEVKITSPLEDEAVSQSGFLFKGTAKDVFGIAEVQVQLSDNGKGSLEKRGDLTASYDRITDEWNFWVDSKYIKTGTQIRLYVRAVDRKGNASAWQFVTVQVK